MANYPRLLLAGANSRAGKTTLTMGLILALEKRGLSVQPFKAGPDYIDSSYHTLVSGRICRNLDTWMLSKDAVLELFERQARACDISIIEGAMGLYDGLRGTQDGSSAGLAKMLEAPVILIVDASSMSTSAGALVLGYKEFDKEIDLRGAILNNIGSPSHYASAKDAIEKNAGLKVFGFLPKEKSLILPERHLGLIPTSEKEPLDIFTEKLLGLTEKNIDIDGLLKICQDSKPLPDFKKDLFAAGSEQARVIIAKAKDAAFNFYYEDNLDILEHYGADLIEFSPLYDKRLPPGTDALYIGGGFPELFARALSENAELRKEIYERANSGMPIYAECGGLMYLVKELVDLEGRAFPMAGIFDAAVKMGDKLRAMGYVEIEVLKENILSGKDRTARAHVFHWSRLDRISEAEEFAYNVKKNGESFADGLIKRNVLASYAHIHFGSDIAFAKNFIESCAKDDER